MLNLREGTRRVGLVLGIVGCLAGGTLGYLRLQTVWRNHTRFKQLSSLPIMEKVNAAINAYPDDNGLAKQSGAVSSTPATPEHVPKFNPNAPYTVAPPSDSQIPTGRQGKPEHGQREKYRPEGRRHPGPSSKTSPQSPTKTSGDIFDQVVFQPLVVVHKANWFDKNASGLEDSNIEFTADTSGVDGIQKVDADKGGVITAIQLSSGEWVHREPQTLKARLAFYGRLLLLLCYPLIGFLLPWGTIRTLAWVVSGFSTPTTTV